MSYLIMKAVIKLENMEKELGFQLYKKLDKH